GVTLTDTVPGAVAAPGWTVGGANGASCAPNPVAGGALLTCNFGTVAAGQSRTITLTATTTPANCPVSNNSAHVAASDEAAAQQGNNDAGPVPINVNCPDVTVTKAAAQITINAGDQASYTITVTNNGPGDAANVTLTDTVPSSVAAPGWAVGGANGGDCAPNPVAGGALLTCNFGTVAAGQSRTITLTATTTAANCPVINNSAHVAASNEAAADQGNNDAGPVPINVTCIVCDLTVEKTCEVPTPPYECTKPITSLTMKWDGAQCIRITGVAGVTPFDISDICPGDVITVSGYDGSQGNNVRWNLFVHGTNTQLGQSSF